MPLDAETDALTGDSTLAAWLALPGEDYIAAAVMELRPGMISIACRPCDIRRIGQVGESATLCVKADGYLSVDNIKVIIEHVRKCHREALFRLRIVDYQRISTLLPRSAFNAANRRSSPRVTVPQEDSHDIEMHCLATGHVARPRIVNISTGGILLRFDHSCAPKAGAVVEIRFSLRGRYSPIRLRGEVVNLRPASCSVLCGIRYVEPSSSSQQLKDIEAYVSKRILELAREARGEA